MKVLMTGGVIVMAPECADDHAAMHQMACEGITSMRLMDDDQTTEVHGAGLRGPLVIQTGGGRKPVAPAMTLCESNNARSLHRKMMAIYEDLCDMEREYGKKSPEYERQLDHSAQFIRCSLQAVAAAFLGYSSSSPR